MYSINDIKRSMVINVKNIPGWSCNRKIVAFISDDWGDLRIHSDEEYEKLRNRGIGVENSMHTKVESLATAKDLYDLYEVLTSVKDANGRHAVFTPFTILANPDFEKIKASGFSKYYAKPFTEELYERDGDLSTLNAWKKGIKEKLFLPEMHGKEHVSVPVWIRKLKSGNELYRYCFNNRYAHFTDSKMAYPLVATYYFENDNDFETINEGIIEGANIFEEIFDHRPTVFNPPNAIFHPRFYDALATSGVKNLDSAHMRIEPDGRGGVTKRRHKFGEISEQGLVHFISNVAFEPVKEIPDVVENTLRQVAAAFRWNKPALINTHRVNYISGRGNYTRGNNLRALKELLNSILKRWPDAEFMGVGEFSRYMNKTLARRK